MGRLMEIADTCGPRGVQTPTADFITPEQAERGVIYVDQDNGMWVRTKDWGRWLHCRWHGESVEGRVFYERVNTTPAKEPADAQAAERDHSECVREKRDAEAERDAARAEVARLAGEVESLKGRLSRVIAETESESRKFWR
jgi:hypothetical protein